MLIDFSMLGGGGSQAAEVAYPLNVDNETD
jgi:hypothetical protein